MEFQEDADQRRIEAGGAQPAARPGQQYPVVTQEQVDSARAGKRIPVSQQEWDELVRAVGLPKAQRYYVVRGGR